MNNGIVEFLRGLIGRRGPSGPVPMSGQPEFQCWACRAVLPKAGVACPACGEPPVKI